MKAFEYFGSKNSPGIQRWIIENLSHHSHYVEPFGGSGAIVLNKSRADREILCDIYQPSLNFFRWLKRSPIELINLIKQTFLSDEFEPKEFVKTPPSDGDTIEDAANFWLYCEFSWSGGGTRWSSGFSSAAVWANPWSLREVSDRLQTIEIRKQCAFEVIAQLPRQDDFLIYCDPPYRKSVRKSKDDRIEGESEPRKQYQHEFTDEQHIELARLLQGRNAIVSGYQSELYDSIYEGWEKRSKRHANDTEVIWISPIAMQNQTQLSLELALCG